MKLNNYLTESLLTGTLLSFSGGFLDIYTYLYRGGVFANAITGNMVMLGLGVAELNLLDCTKYFVAICAYFLGIVGAELIKFGHQGKNLLLWQQWILLIEIILLILICFVPYGKFDHIVNTLVAFICALQVQSFRKVNNLPFASTMCTGNLRSCGEKFFNGWILKDKQSRIDTLYYIILLTSFVGGAVFGAVALKNFGKFALLFSPFINLIVFFIIHRDYKAKLQFDI